MATNNPGDQPRAPEHVEGPEGPRPGRHPEAERTSGGRPVAIALAVILALVALVFIGRVVAATFAG
jgi:hypothetical protein